MGAVAAREGRYCGFNLSWTPVADVAFNHRSNVVNTRAFGSDARAVARMCSAYMDGAAENGFARVIKHWPGDGLDDRDQHFATTHNTLEMPVWHETFGAIYRQAIADGVQMIMAGHITLADYTRSLGDEASAPAHMPATVNADLNLRLLRGEFGFNGVIVSDASGMNGFQALGARSDLVPLCIESGCDILLFPDDVGQDIAHLQRGLETGALSRTRVDDAVLRILALKASLGLHLSHGRLPDADLGDASFATREHAVWAEQVSEQAVTLVKDTQNLLPLRPDVHRRILLAQLSKRFSPSGPLPDLQIAALLQAEGFEITPYGARQDINPDDFDIGMYVMAEEGVSAKEYLGPHWEALHGAFPASMDRLWHHLPTLYVSLGTPFLLFHMPECKTFVNAYSAIPVMQRAVVAALLGRTACCGQSPVDAFCGLTEARF